MIIIRAAPEAHVPWLAERANLAITPQLRCLEAMDEESGSILAMVGYDGWMPNCCQMHVAVDRPFAAKRFLRAAFGIPFIETGRDLVVGWVLGTNQKAIDLDRRLGFRETYRVHDGWMRGVDLVLFEMRKNECRWLGKAEA